ncbi:ATP-binding protein [Actinorugispora endophytica]|uniref:Serine/threonine-protein kinase RsbW n=1 Tax=Actinorugispora endophytica TaxID=1605990 RepID=A0A4R6V907_9ACTN|nr:ATP-binding protein [Actinorugispora endophytica]TDQ55278.1 serine/threonine-protein kinase RsbW [Actinorugispora endophytica]
MDERFSIALPRAAYTVPVMRQFMGGALEANGVCAECLSDILVAVTEACANVVDHGDPAPGYEVLARVRHGFCTLEIVHTGRYFNPAVVPPRPSPDSESGRGILLMRELMDRVVFDTDPRDRITVYLAKRLCVAPSLTDPRLTTIPVPR